MGMRPDGSVVTMQHTKNEFKRIELHMGYVKMITTKDGKESYLEIPRPELGWEYEVE